jgi:hypothetical protein
MPTIREGAVLGPRLSLILVNYILYKSDFTKLYSIKRIEFSGSRGAKEKDNGIS